MDNGIIKYTTVGELIEELKKYDPVSPICLNGCASVYVDARPWYYDGGYVAQDSKDSDNYKRSKDYSSGLAKLGKGFHTFCVDLIPNSPSDEDKIENRRVREIDSDSWEFLEKIEMEERNIFGGQIVRYKGFGAYSEEFKCWPVIAYLDSGEQAIASCMKDAKDELIKIWRGNETNKNK